MLLEIKCDKFMEHGKPRPPIGFHPGLNVILGDELGANSIGKSTFLLIIDFVFGGDDFAQKAEDVKKNVGEHTICFAFKFGERIFHYSRSTANYRIVMRCNEDYAPQEALDIDEYRRWLSDQYGIIQDGLTFRGTVSRFLRVYQRDNLNEKRPLNSSAPEQGSEIVRFLMKLFNLYSALREARTTYDSAVERKNKFNAAKNEKFIPILSGKKEYKFQKGELLRLQAAQEPYNDTDWLRQHNAEEINKIYSLRSNLQKERCILSRLKTKITKIEEQLNLPTQVFESDFTALISFFPTVSIKRIEEIETFHQGLLTILQEELKEELSQTRKLLDSTTHNVESLEQELALYDVPSGISKKVLQDFSDISQKINEIKQKIDNYETYERLRADVKSYKTAYENLSTSILLEIQTRINNQMLEYNNFIFDNKKEPPIITLGNSKYDFRTINDTGTGNSLKSLIIFDLSILKLTNLPILIHESIIFKSIGDKTLEKIMFLYQQFDKKQIFIALDKSASYNSEKTKLCLENNCVLQLGNESSALYGYIWSKRIKQTSAEDSHGGDTHGN